ESDRLGLVAIVLSAARNDGLHDPPRSDHARGDAVRRDPAPPEIPGHTPRVMGDSGFRCAVMGVAAISGRCGPSDRAYRDDLPGMLLLHDRDDGVARIES